MLSVEEANAKMDKVVDVLEKEFRGCLFVIVALTDNQENTRYVSNMTRDDASEVITDLCGSSDFANGGEEDRTLN